MRDFESRLDPQILARWQKEGHESAPHAWSLNPALTTEDFTIPGPEGAPDVLLRVYHFAERDDTPAPAVFYIHGGGFQGGTYTDQQEYWEKIILATGAVVFTIEYRLAPEHPFPAGFDDCYTALEWIAASAERLRVDPNRLVVAGGSAGGCLAAAVALKARDTNGPDLYYQFLLVPMLDDRMITPSSTTITDSRVFHSEAMKECWAAYLGEHHEDVSPYAAPARATDLSGLPPAYVYVEDLDPLRDEDITYAMRLMGAGVTTELHVVPGTYHGSFVFEPQADASKRAVAEHIAFFKRIFGAG